MQGCTNVTSIASHNSNVAPYILVAEDPLQIFLVVDKMIVCEITTEEDIPLILMSAFFSFNICYPKGSNNFYSFMEIVTLSFPIDKASSTVKHFLTSLDACNIED